MKIFSQRVAILFVLTTWVLINPTQASESNGLSEETQNGIGCLVVSSAAMAAALWAGPSETVMIAAGGLLVPSGTTPLMIGLTATVAVASCGVGSAATPAAMWLAEQIGIISGPTDVAVP